MASTCWNGLRADENGEKNPHNGHAKKRKSGMDVLAGSMLKFTWTQKKEAITIRLQLGNQVLKEQGTVFNRDKIQVWFEDGGRWEIKPYKPIKPQSARIRKQKNLNDVFLFAEKEVSEEWPSLEDEQSSEEASEASGEEGCTTSHDEVAMDIAPSETEVGTEKEEKIEENDDKNEIQEEDPVIPVEVHTSEYQKDEILTLTLYVKKIIRSTAQVKFERNRVTVKFQTTDGSFLNSHKESTADTFFIWSKEVDEVDTKKCRYIVSSVKMEIKLTMVSTKKKVGFDNFSKKEAPHSRSDPWIPLCKSQAETSKVQAASSTTLGARNHNGQPKSTKFSETPQIRAASIRGQGDGAAAQDVELGRVGLVNDTLNCYLNVVIQTLAHLPHIRDYILERKFYQDVGDKEKTDYLIYPFAVLVQKLWQRNGPIINPRAFLATFGKRYPQLNIQTGQIVYIHQVQHIQQDAHEVLCMLLDGLHEDLKRTPMSTAGLPALQDGSAEALGQRAWEVTKATDDSKIMDIVRGQYRSSVVCTVCQKESCSFDPYTSHTLPIPQAVKPIHATFLWRDFRRRPVKYALLLPTSCRLSDLKSALSSRTGVKPNRMRVFKADKGKVECTFSADGEIISRGCGSLMVCEVLTDEDAGEKVWEIRVSQRKLPSGDYPRCAYCNKEKKLGVCLRGCQNCWRVAYCNNTCQKSHWERHKFHCKPLDGVRGTPFFISLPESKATYSTLIRHLKGFARYSVTVTPLAGTERPGSGGSGERGPAGPRQGSISPQLTTHASLSNLSSSSSQSSGSLNSLDSQSSGNSTSTLTADVQQEEDAEDVDMQGGAVGGSRDSVEQDSCYSSLASNGSLLVHHHKSRASHILESGEFATGSLRSDGADSGCVEMEEDDRDPLPFDFYIKPVTEEGVAIRANRLGDLGDKPLDFSNYPYISMDWGKDYDVETKELDTDFEGDAGMREGSELPVTLEQCLQAFMKEEYLEGSNEWRCPQCRKPVRAAKHLSLWRLPPVLIISLKRFHKGHYFVNKDETKVHFPVNNLDLSNFCSKEQNKDGLIYDLYAVIHHQGSLNGGHYFADIRCNEDFTPGSDPQWVRFNDDQVKPVQEKDLITRDAYILIYRVRQPSSQAPAQTPAPAQTQPVPNGFGGNTAAAAAEASVVSAVNPTERKNVNRTERRQAWAAVPQHNRLDDQDEIWDDDMSDDDDEVVFEDPMGFYEPGKVLKFDKIIEAEPEKANEDKMDLRDLDESDLNNSCPNLVRAEAGEHVYTDMDSLD